MDHNHHLCDACRRKEYGEFKHACVHEAIEKSKKWIQHFKISEWPRWDYNPEESILYFSENGQRRVTCNVQIVGTVQGNSWEWSWGNKNLDSSHRKDLDLVRLFGEEKDWQLLTTLFLENDEYLGWECSAVACHVLSGQATYRFQSSNNSEHYTYLLVTDSQFAS